jgi:hypothetical protein
MRTTAWVHKHEHKEWTTADPDVLMDSADSSDNKGTLSGRIAPAPALLPGPAQLAYQLAIR